LQRLTMQTVQGGLSIGVQPIPSSCPSSSPASRPSTTLSLQLGSSESLASLSTISARLETALSGLTPATMCAHVHVFKRFIPGDNAVDVPQPLATGSFVRKLKTVHQLSLRVKGLLPGVQSFINALSTAFTSTGHQLRGSPSGFRCDW